MAYVTFEWLVTSPDLFEAGGSDGLCDFWMTGDFSWKPCTLPFPSVTMTTSVRSCAFVHGTTQMR